MPHEIENFKNAEELEAFLSTLPSGAALKLLAGIERQLVRGQETGLPVSLIRRGIRPLLREMRGDRPGLPTPLRLFCQPFEDLLVNEEEPSKKPGVLERRSILPIWAWLTDELLPDLMPDLCERMAGYILQNDSEALNASVAVMYESCAAVLMSAIQNLEEDREKRTAFIVAYEHERFIEDARDMAHTLTIAPQMLELQNSLPNPITTLSASQVRECRSVYEDVYELTPDHAIYVAFAAMGRLEHPWEILRLAKDIANRHDDLLISKTDFAVLGDRLLQEVEYAAQNIADIRPGRSNPITLEEDVYQFAVISKGMTAEMDILRISEWGIRLMEARKIVSAAVDDLLARLPKNLSSALPLQRIGAFGRSGPRRPDLSTPPNSDKIERVMASIMFLAHTEPFAEAVCSKNVYAESRTELEEYLLHYEEGLIEEIRLSEGDARTNALSLLEATADMEEIAMG
ncbi:MAG: hypothetical protein KUG61_05215, partial [Parvibaculaceae bacterium]|nr:hypothetical protein [Parvibaculaceae bacterium]